jgi:hypothetical protein
VPGRTNAPGTITEEIEMLSRTKSAVAVASGLMALTGVSVAGVGSASGSAHAPPTARVKLAPSSAALAACFPHAAAKVTVALTTDAIGKDTFTIKASGLKPKTDFTVFLIEKAGAPFGAVEYIGDITTDRYGRASNRFTLIVEEAFAFDNVTNVRKELNSVGFWFADPKDDDSCLGKASPVTRFDGDDSAGVQMMNSGLHLLP